MGEAKNGKMYFARFTNKKTKQVEFYKFGHTRSYDALDRFKHEPEQYEPWDIKIMATVYGPIEEMIGIEETFKAIYPKNLWIEEKISGVTETVVLNKDQINNIIEALKRLNNKYWQKREKARAIEEQEKAFEGVE
jgi:hypothetical protein